MAKRKSKPPAGNVDCIQITIHRDGTITRRQIGTPYIFTRLYLLSTERLQLSPYHRLVRDDIIRQFMEIDERNWAEQQRKEKAAKRRRARASSAKRLAKQPAKGRKAKPAKTKAVKRRRRRRRPGRNRKP
jgi:hypothetical protein